MLILTLLLGVGDGGRLLLGSLHCYQGQDDTVDILPLGFLELTAVKDAPTEGDDPWVDPVFDLLRVRQIVQLGVLGQIGTLSLVQSPRDTGLPLVEI